MKQVPLPKLNEKDLPDVSDEVKKKLKFRLVENVNEVLAAALEVKRQARPTPRMARKRKPRLKKF